ncbi:hypothetical protein FPQ18DRAFT_358106 [Pyronema domesticum]|nr:hypothetical protein FPQ18DRAFT_358106 [Pyronema domesticum]
MFFMCVCVCVDLDLIFVCVICFPNFVLCSFYIPLYDRDLHLVYLKLAAYITTLSFICEIFFSVFDLLFLISVL